VLGYALVLRRLGDEDHPVNGVIAKAELQQVN